MKKKLLFGLIISFGLFICSFGVVNHFVNQSSEPQISYADEEVFEETTYTYATDNYSYTITLTSDNECQVIVTKTDLTSTTFSATYAINEDRLTITFETMSVLDFTINADNTLSLYETQGTYDYISQGAKDFIASATALLNEPLVIGGVSITLGAIVLFVITKLFSTLSKTKIKSLAKQIATLTQQSADSISRKDYNELLNNFIAMKDVMAVLVDGTKNVNVKEKAQALLVDIKPVLEKAKEVIEQEDTPTVVQEDTSSASKVLDIINKD